jgi:hypothetical protein
VPVIETPEHIAATELATRELNAPYLTAIMEGRYRESFLATAGADALSHSNVAPTLARERGWNAPSFANAQLC